MDSADRFGKDRRAIYSTNIVRKTQNTEDDLNEEPNQEEEIEEDE